MRKLVVVVAAGMLLGYAAACWAQYGYYDEEMAPKQNAIKLGMFRPQDSHVRQDVGSTWWAVAYERVIKTMPKGDELTLELGYINKNGPTEGRLIPLTLNYRAYMAQGDEEMMEAKGRAYAGAGLGVYSVRYHYPPADFTWSKTKFGANAFAGYTTGDYLIELKYHWVGEEWGVKNGGFALMAGYKF